MPYRREKVNILTNIALCTCATILSLGVAEYILRQTSFEELSGNVMYIKKYGSKLLISSVREGNNSGKPVQYTDGDCYPSDATGFLPLEIINPDDGKNWHCVLYDHKKRLQGYHPDRRRQIAIVGDSFVFGIGVREVDTLGYILNGSYQKINFQNWGQRGADIGHIVQRCKDIVESKQELNEVIYFYNLNDVRMSTSVSSQQKHIIDFQNVLWLKDEQRMDTLERILSEKSALFALIRKTWVIQFESYLTVRNYKDMYFNENNRQEFLATMDSIQSIKDMLAAHGISFRVVIYPLLYKDLLGRYPFEQIHKVIMSECKKRRITCLDGYVPFNDYYSLKRFVVHPLDYHPNGLSNLLLVDYIHKTNFIPDRPH